MGTVGKVISDEPAALAIHASLGLLLIVGALALALGVIPAATRCRPGLQNGIAIFPAWSPSMSIQMPSPGRRSSRSCCAQ